MKKTGVIAAGTIWFGAAVMIVQGIVRQGHGFAGLGLLVVSASVALLRRWK